MKSLRIDQVREALGCSRMTVYRLISSGELTAFKVRGSLRITSESVDGFRRRQIAIFQAENGIIPVDSVSSRTRS